LDVWAEVMSDEENRKFLVKCQKNSSSPDLPLSVLLSIPIKHLGEYAKALANIAIEIAGLDSKALPKRPYVIKSPSLPVSGGLGGSGTIAGFISAIPKSTKKIARGTTNFTQSAPGSPNIDNRIVPKSIKHGSGAGNVTSTNVKRRQSQGVIPKFITKTNLTQQRSPRTSTLSPLLPNAVSSASLAKSEPEVSETAPDDPPRLLKRSLSRRDKGAVALGLKKKTMSVGEVRNKMSPKPPKPSTPTKVTKEQLHKLQQAISDKNSHKMNEILKYDKTLVNTPDTSGKTPMHLACVDGPLSVVKVLTKNGPDIDIQDEAGWSPFAHCCPFGHLELLTKIWKRS